MSGPFDELQGHNRDAVEAHTAASIKKAAKAETKPDEPAKSK